jgi:hypothetical protein
MMQSCILDGQYLQVKTPFAQEKVFNSFPPLLVLITEVITYVLFCHTMVETVSPLLESGSIHLPARPGIASRSTVAEAVGVGGMTVGTSVAWVTACGATTVCKTAVIAGVAAGGIVNALVQETPAKSRQIAIIRI